MPLSDIVKGDVITCSPDLSIKEVANLMKDNDVGAVLVTAGEKPIGICTDRDIVVRCVAEKFDLTGNVEQIMTKSVETVTLDHGIQDVIRLMRDKEIRRIPVVDHDGKVKGLVSFGDIVGLLAKELGQISATTAVEAAA